MLRIDQKQHAAFNVIHPFNFRNFLPEENEELSQLLVLAEEDLRRRPDGRRGALLIERNHQSLFILNVRKQFFFVLLKQLRGAIQIQSQERALMFEKEFVELPMQFEEIAK